VASASRAGDGGPPVEPSPVPADFRASWSKLGARFLSKGHGQRFDAVLWVNDVAHGAWDELPAPLPEKSVIVEEATDVEARGDRAAGLLVMEKKPQGWRFLAVGSDGEVVDDDHGVRCLSCHRDAPADDVFVEITREAR
jgi:hypothetical protein